MPNRTSVPVTQEGHGFVRGTCVVFDGTNWITVASGYHGVGVVGDIKSADVFEFVQTGAIDGLEGLTPGAVYYPAANGGLSTTASGTAVGTAYTDRVLLVGPAGGSSVSTGTVDTSLFVTKSELVAAIAAAVAAAQETEDSRHLHSIQYDAVISVDEGNVGIVFSESDGTQVLVG